MKFDRPDDQTVWYSPATPLDLDFVVADSGMTSLRLGDIIKWR
jgi:hypothetical protein